MKKTTIVLLFTLFLIQPLFSQTAVSGAIASNTVWTLAGSPYIVTDNIDVSESATLTIEPGVVVKFSANTGMELHGYLSAIGTETNRIVFTSNLTSPTIGSWNGITVIGTSILLLDNQLIMQYVDGLYATTFVDLDLAYHGPYNFENCYFAYNENVNHDGGSPSTNFRSCSFEYNTTGLNYFQFGGTISQCIFEHNVNGALNTDKIDSCYFNDNSGIALSPYGITRGCKIVNNVVGVSCLFNAVNDTFIDNVITNNEIGVEILSYFNGSITFTGNTICANSLYNISMQGTNDADLSQNCWCTSDNVAIRATIYDETNDPLVGAVTFAPIGTDCPLNALSLQEEASLSPSVSVYPNPFSESFTVELVNAEHATLVLYELSGRIVFTQPLSFSTTIQTSDLNEGIYLYHVTNNDQVETTGKIIKE